MTSQGSIDSLGEQYIGAVTPSVSPDYQPGVVHGGSGVSASSNASSLRDELRVTWWGTWIMILLAAVSGLIS